MSIRDAVLGVLYLVMIAATVYMVAIWAARKIYRRRQ